MIAEVVGGFVSGSLALIADAGHMLTDFASLALAWYGIRLSRRPADWQRTYGYDRFAILIAFANGLALLAIAVWITGEAIARLTSPTPVLGGLMLWVAVTGLLVNIVAFVVLHGGSNDSLNVRAAAGHVLGDLLGSVAAIIAAVVIVSTGWTPIDPLLSALVALIVARTGWSVVRQSAHILLEGTPEGIDTREIAVRLASTVSGVVDVHHVHAWSISERRPMVTLHARIGETSEPTATIAEIKRILVRDFGIAHTTVEIEYDRCADSPVDVDAADARAR